MRDTLNAVVKLVKKKDNSTKLQSEILEKLNRLAHDIGPRIVRSDRPLSFEFVDCDVPSVDMGFVYLAVSSHNARQFKIGHCLNIREELEKLNNPSVVEDRTHCPYVLLSFIVGFDGDPKSPVSTHTREETATFMSISRFRDIRQDFRYARLMCITRRKFAQLRDHLRPMDLGTDNLVLKECYTIPLNLRTLN